MKLCSCHFGGQKALHCTTMQLVIRQAAVSVGAEAVHLCFGLLSARLHLRDRVGDWTSDHVADSFKGLDMKDDDVLRSFVIYLPVHGYVQALLCATRWRGKSTLYLSLTLDITRFTRRSGGGGLKRPWICYHLVDPRL